MAVLAGGARLLADTPAPAAEPDAGRPSLEAPLALRGQFPLGLPFIDLTPRTAYLAGAGVMRWRIDLSYLSTHAASDALLETFSSESTRPPDGRVTETVLVDTAATTSSRHAYYVDGETARMTIGMTWGVSRRVEIDATLPLLAHGGGVLDSAINEFHSSFHLPDGGRPDFANDQYVVGLTDDGETLFLGEAPQGLGMGDLLLEARVALSGGHERRHAVAAVGAIEIPTGDPDRLDGNGTVDVAAGVEATWRAVRSTWNMGAAYAIPGTFDPAPGLAPRNRIAGYVSAAVLLENRWSALFALHGVTGPFGREQGGSLGGTSLETSIGFRHQATGGGVFEMAVLENLTSEHNVPDVGFYLAWGFAPTGSSRVNALNPP
ncbi:MAG TPA: DUF3187 family protein [Candidatus Polarisedimenticolia bacterium]|nr:DUF3187 family protein [Candidatus Polarisedimenticolia bacterium]